ncbi:MAG: ferredoxin family protein [Arcicella sp.]|nr:ferredoxin family protein [Arcicella sp.]
MSGIPGAIGARAATIGYTRPRAFPTIEERTIMTYVVSESLHQVQIHRLCGRLSMDCFTEGPNFLVIDPDECIDCTLCVAECPAEAIFAEDDLPADQEHFISLNAELSRFGLRLSSAKIRWRMRTSGSR